MRRIAQTMVWILVGASITFGAAAQGWISEDIGDTLEGSFDDNNGSLTIEANGLDIWAAEDAFRFTCFETSGDFELLGRVLSLEVTNEWAKSGLMVRDSLDANSPNVYVNLTASHGVKVIHRDTVGGQTGPDPAQPNAVAPVYLRMVRAGDLFSSYLSEDRATWELAEIPGAPAEITLAMTDPVFVGIAVTSHVAGTLTTSEWDSMQGSFLPVEPRGKVATTWAQVKAGL